MYELNYHYYYYNTNLYLFFFSETNKLFLFQILYKKVTAT